MSRLKATIGRHPQRRSSLPNHISGCSDDYSWNWSPWRMKSGSDEFTWCLFSHSKQHGGNHKNIWAVGWAYSSNCTSGLQGVCHDQWKVPTGALCAIEKALYGMLNRALLFYKKLIEGLEWYEFWLNPYNPCMAKMQVNESQVMVTWQVDDLKVSH